MRLRQLAVRGCLLAQLLDDALTHLIQRALLRLHVLFDPHHDDRIRIQFDQRAVGAIDQYLVAERGL